VTGSLTGLLVVLAAAVACGLAGLGVPAVVRRLPQPQTQPEPQPEPASVGTPAASVDRFEEPPPPPFVVVAARPGLRWLTAGLSAAGGVVVAASAGWSWPLLFLLPTVPVGVLLGYVDLRTRLLPKVVVVPATLAAIVLVAACAAVTGDGQALVRALLGMVVARSVYWALWWIHSVGIGFGDVRLAALLGLELGWFGWGELAVGTYAAFLVFGLPGLAVAVLRRDRRFLRTAFPFGPAMLVGALIGLVAGADLWAHLVGGAA
jgi:leader peptidase (prepilin peptidase)/N-methyltransferase